ncbi:IclR family transcriptional regulator [Sphingomonas gilva]|uniref:IclR family transcriptional regulator n=1 Tax=Sphingomonas gilva TaxID=2305907 RepID=A0A396RRB8_9SPHN|nr:IclR family transcriptional regulator [Sphingomonas gilva]RHW18929.1 IclR family transcriptional regulator [Sphingomonas gilva]
MAEAGRKRKQQAGGATYSAPALEKGFDVIELLATVPAGLTVRDIAERLGRSISEIFRMIIVMEQRRWLSKDPESDRYRVTYKMLDLAYRATPAQELASVAAPILGTLAHRAEQSCHLVVRHEAKALVLLRQESPGQIGLSARLGTVVDLVASCSGHILLAFSEPEQLDAVLACAPMPAQTDEAALRSLLAQVRARGYETMQSARVAGVRDMSYPVFGFDGSVVAALTIPFVTFIDGSQTIDFDRAREMLAIAARDISIGLGYAAT